MLEFDLGIPHQLPQFKESMKKLFTVVALGLSLSLGIAHVAAGDLETTLQNKLGMCSKEAGDKKGDERKIFMKECLTSPPGNEPPKPIVKTPYFVDQFGLWNVNSVGGVEPFAVFSNPNESSAIKYIRLKVSMFNAVGDLIRSSIGHESTSWIRYTGPLAYSQGNDRVEWSPVWYNTSATCLKIQTITVEFMNNSIRTYSGKTLAQALNPAVSNSCKSKIR